MFKKYKQLMVGIVIGSIIAGVGAASASGSFITAQVADFIKFKFDGVEKQVPEGYTVLMYQDRTYVPARFVAEQLDANVEWDNNNNTVIVQKKTGSTPTNEPGKVGHYTFSNYSLDSSSDYATTVIGELQNNDTKKHDITFKVNFYNASGKLLGSASGYVLDIEPGQKKSFEAIAMPKIDGIATYSFQINTEL